MKTTMLLILLLAFTGCSIKQKKTATYKPQLMKVAPEFVVLESKYEPIISQDQDGTWRVTLILPAKKK